MKRSSIVPKNNCRYVLKLTTKQIQIVTSALHEYTSVCLQDANLTGGINMELVKLAKAMDRVRHSIQVQENKERVKRGHVQQLNKFRGVK